MKILHRLDVQVDVHAQNKFLYYPWSTFRLTDRKTEKEWQSQVFPISH